MNAPLYPQGIAAPGTLSPATRSRLLGVLLLFNFLLYANCLFNGFVFDDHSQIELNPYVHSFRYVGKLFGTSLLAQQGKQAVPNFYRPLTNFTFLVGYKLFGESPLGYHLISILLHCTAVWLVFLVGSKLFRSDWLGLLAAFLFSVHPAHVEPIAWIDAVGDPLVTVFLLLAFLCYFRLDQPGSSSTKILSAGMLLAFAAALFTKETAVIFPVLAMIFEHFYRADRAETRWTKKLARYGSLWLTFAAYIALRVAAVGQLIPSQLHSEVTPGEAVFSAIALVGQYARKLIWPAPLVAFYPFQKSTSLFQPPVLLGLCVIVGALALFVFLWRRAHLYSFTLLWMALAIAPALNTRWMTASVFAERYLYLPSVAFSWLVAGGLLWMWNRAGEKARITRLAMAAALGLVCCLAAYASVARSSDWRSDRSVVVSTLRVLPDSPHTHVQYGIFRWAEGDHAEAVREWQLALSLNPQSVEAMAELGRASLAEKNYDQAQQWLGKAIALKPNFATPHVLLGEVFLAQGKHGEAEAEFQRAIADNPTETEALNALGTFYLQNHRLEDAAREFQASAQISSVMSTWVSLGEIYNQLGQPDNAADAWSHVVALERFNPEAHRSLGQIYLSRRQWNAAESEFQMCLLMNPKDPVALAGMEKIKAASISGDSKSSQ
jgi:protein O-mannosyl-transferase